MRDRGRAHQHPAAARLVDRRGGRAWPSTTPIGWAASSPTGAAEPARPHACRSITPALLLSAYAAGHLPDGRGSRQPHRALDRAARARVSYRSTRFHVPRRLRRTCRQQPFVITADTDFPAVIRACAEPTPDRPRTWLNDDLIGLYIELHRARPRPQRRVPARRASWSAASTACRLAAAFFGESMFVAPARRQQAGSGRAGRQAARTAATGCWTPSSSPRIWSSSAPSRCRARTIAGCSPRR